jgi:hypothetical protein
MDRLYKRPMFRKGGSADSAGTGITSGLAPRQGYATNENNTVKQDDLSKVDIRNMNLQQLKDLSQRMSYKAPPMQSNNSLNDFLINFGLDIASRSPEGNIFQTAAASAKEPFKNFQASKAAYKKEINDRSINKYNSESDMFKTLIGAQGDILGSEGGSKSYRDGWVADKLEAIIPKIYEIEGRVSKGTATDDDVMQLDILKTQKNNLTKSNPVTEGAIEIFVKSPAGQNLFNTLSEDLLAKDLKGKYKDENDTQLYIDAIEKIKQILGQFSGGGRAGYANGELVEEQFTETVAPGAMGGQNMNTDNPISYDQLRARLPNEITDDIVELISNSAEALEDFAMISEQSQVDQFNRKYSVNLVLPAEA